MASAGSDSIRELISRLMLGTALMLRKGRNTLRVLRARRFGIFGITSISLNHNGDLKKIVPNDYNEEVNPVPPVSKVSIPVDKEAHCENFDKTLEGEKHSK